MGPKQRSKFTMRRRLFHCWRSLLVATTALFATIGTTSAFHQSLLPPWRGPKQLLHIGPMGVELDLMLSRFREPHVMHVDMTLSDNSNMVVPTVLPLEELPPVFHPATKRIVAISDTHGKHHCIQIPKADVLLHCGDVLLRYGYLGTRGSSKQGLKSFDEWLGRQPAQHKLMIAGNHDKRIQKKNWLPKNAQLLDGSKVINVAGLSFFGSPYSPKGTTGNKAFQKAHIGQRHAAVLNQPVDVLVTHAKCDEFSQVASNHARVWAHGHFHDHYGVNVLETCGTLCVNAAICDMIYRPVNPPIVLDLIPSITKRLAK